ncbi:MAG: sigma-70 family RNA polymerase sigma factor [Gammaproteobacteria bacterium]|nr:sigma-70 family RNA polymerase sigma factor [Gammaproteobacteria bacterium]MBU1441950.1 sigma-70 family RNA polymerase sigma factor [Gammaproteobacteria bacterium]
MLAALVYARRTHSDIDFDDYLQFARVGLIEAIDRFDPGRGIRFKTFASKRVQGAILTGLTRLTEKNQQISVRSRIRSERLQAAKQAAAEAVALAAGGATATPQARLFGYLAEVGIGLALGVLLDNTGMVDAEAFESDAHAPPPDVSYFRKSEMARLRSLLRERVGELSEAHRAVIRGHYLQDLPFEEIARGMGVTRGRVSQIHRQALSSLRDTLGNEPRFDLSY